MRPPESLVRRPVMLALPPSRVAATVGQAVRARGRPTIGVHEGARAVESLAEGTPCLAIVDVDLPGLDWGRAAEALAASVSRSPVIILTPRERREQVLAALDGTRDDYVLTPARVDDLLARVWLRLRGSDAAAQSSLVVGRVAADLDTRRARVAGVPVSLTPTEFALLVALLRHPGEALSRARIAAEVWSETRPPTPNAVEVYVGYLRRKLGPGVIRTVRGVGYVVEDDPGR
jgi:two-component system response regulator QseB